MPAALMIAGGLLLLVAAVRLPSALRSRTPEASSPAEASGELCVGRPCRANDDPLPTRGYEVPSIAVDPGDIKHQVVGDVNLIKSTCGWHTTFDGGLSWQDGVFELPPGFRRCQFDSAGLLPMGNVAIGAGGTVYAVFSSIRVDGGRPAGGLPGDSVLLATSSDGGRTFAPAREIIPGGGRDRSYVRPALVVLTPQDGVDRLLLSMWGCMPGRCTQGYFTRSDDGGRTFAPPLLMTPPPGGNSPSSPAVAPDGSIYMTFLRRANDGQTELLVARSGDEGKTFDSGIIDNQNQIGQRYDSAKIAVDPGRGWVYIVFSDARDGPPRVFFRRSRDKGRTWERVVRLPKGPGGRAFSPAMSVAPDGRIEVVFYQRARQADDVYATYSIDGGRTFAAAQKLNDRAINRRLGYQNEVGDWYTPAVVATPSAAVFAWIDTRDGTPLTNSQETFTRRIARPSARPAG